MLKKVAICLPSYNESENISQITKQIDDALCFFDDKFESVIINSDNNSPDKTSNIFMNTYTIHKKISIVLDKRGKGYNITEFFYYCKNNDINYAITLDADLKSFNKSWLDEMFKALDSGYDFVCPNYKRRKEEGNTTNHFVVPILYVLYGKFIRQPIGGDYAFNKRYINDILKNDLSDNIMGYGIDIYMVIFALCNNFKVTEVELGEKVHGVSYYKIVDIFNGVAKGLMEARKSFETLDVVYEKIDYKPYKLANKKWDFLENVYANIDFDIEDLNYEDIYQKWLNILNDYLHFREDSVQMEKLFIKRVVSFWEYVNKNNIEDFERLIVKSCIDLRRLYETTNTEGI